MILSIPNIPKKLTLPIFIKSNFEDDNHINSSNSFEIDPLLTTYQVERYETLKWTKSRVKIKLINTKNIHNETVFRLKMDVESQNTHNLLEIYAHVYLQEKNEKNFKEIIVNLKRNGNNFYISEIIPKKALEVGKLTILLKTIHFNYFKFFEGQKDYSNMLEIKINFEANEKIDKNEIISNDNIYLKYRDQLELEITNNGQQTWKNYFYQKININSNLDNSRHNKNIFNIEKNTSYIKIKKAVIQDLNFEGSNQINCNPKTLEIESFTFPNDNLSKTKIGIGKNSKRGYLIAPKFSGELYPKLILEFENIKYVVNFISKIRIENPLLKIYIGRYKLKIKEEKVNKMGKMEMKNLENYYSISKTNLARIINHSFSLEEIKEWSKNEK
ncbi:MAG: hypothetical protein ACRCRZ_01550 [Metamycoplasmataceae bacterium]